MKSGKEAQHAAKALKTAMGIKGDLKPGDLQMRANAMRAEGKKLPGPNTKKGVALRGLI